MHCIASQLFASVASYLVASKGIHKIALSHKLLYCIDLTVAASYLIASYYYHTEVLTSHNTPTYSLVKITAHPVLLHLPTLNRIFLYLILNYLVQNHHINKCTE